jgi:aryl-alcohol dehydrogenase-like predicted oxidoreductase
MTRDATSAPAPGDFLHRHVPAFGRTVHRLGLAASHGVDERGVEAALEAGLQYVFWNPTARRLTAPLRAALRRDRERYVIATGPTFGFFPGAIRRRVERALALLGTDHLDVLQLYWLGRMSAWTERNVAEMVKLREEGKVRVLGVSIHDRARAARLAEDSPLDLLMIRYNAAHPGAERDVFPRLARRSPAIVAYTATAWRKLLRRPRGWEGPVPSAGDCYRFCLSSPHVDVTLCSPANVEQLRENLRALERGPLSAEEDASMRALGRVIHG